MPTFDILIKLAPNFRNNELLLHQLIFRNGWQTFR